MQVRINSYLMCPKPGKVCKKKLFHHKLTALSNVTPLNRKSPRRNVVDPGHLKIINGAILFIVGKYFICKVIFDGLTAVLCKHVFNTEHIIWFRVFS